MSNIKLVKDSNGNCTIGALMSKPGVDDVFIIMTPDGAVRFGIITEIEKNVIKTDKDVYSIHDSVSLDSVGGKNLYLDKQGDTVMAIEPFGKKHFSVTKGSVMHKAGEGSLFKI
jgi:hypothetical protein